MKRKIIKQLTIDEVAEIIKNAILEALNEMDGATYAKLYNASRRAKVDNQNGIYTKSYNINQVEKDTNGETIKTPIRTKTVLNDDVILRAQKMQEPVQQHWLSKYIGKTFKFYGEDRLGLTANILLKFQKITNLSDDKTILVGDITYNDKSISNDGIIVVFNKDNTCSVKYHDRKSKYKYNLEIDNRFKPLWDELLEQIKWR